ncbi:MAG TPA: 50S ribosomal protein L10 [Chloroflexota bacterium]|nr:50S ribosomal protein L10 [Chloroflexota bacterium]
MEKRPTVVRPEKVAAVESIADQLTNANMAVVADYRGLTVAQIADVRRQLRTAGVELHVVKNTLARLAAQRTGKDQLLPALIGPTALAVGTNDPTMISKTLTDVIRTQRLPMQIRSALLGDRLLSAAEVAELATLPSREVLLGQVVGAMQAPIAGFVGVLNGMLQSLVGVLDARRRQLEEAA